MIECQQNRFIRSKWLRLPTKWSRSRVPSTWFVAWHYSTEEGCSGMLSWNVIVRGPIFDGKNEKDPSCIVFSEGPDKTPLQMAVKTTKTTTTLNAKPVVVILISDWRAICCFPSWWSSSILMGDKNQLAVRFNCNAVSTDALHVSDRLLIYFQ